MTDHSKRVRAEVTQLRKLMPIGLSLCGRYTCDISLPYCWVLSPRS
jgi:hypothetical protein